MKKQIWNPYLPLEEYIPDGEPHVFGNRLYLYGSHDKENGNEFCELDYVCYSAPVEDLSDWKCEGVIYRKEQDPFNTDGKLYLYAPDVCQGTDGRYYLYYSLKFSNCISVAVCDTPAGQYEYYGRVSYGDGSLLTENIPYDPSVIYVDGHVYLYYGFAPTTINIARYQGVDKPGGSVVELEKDMLTVKEGPQIVIPSSDYGKGTSFEGHEYFEAPSIRKIGSLYYLVYSAVNCHELCYAVSHEPMSGFQYGGVIISNGDIGYQGRKSEDRLFAIGNNHGGLVEVNGQWYIFYHRHTHLNQYNRQGCAELIQIEPDGSIGQVPITTSGLYGKPLPGRGTYPAVICCNLTNGRMPILPSLARPAVNIDFPYINGKDGEYFIANIREGAVIGYKYFNLKETRKITIVYRGKGEGTVLIQKRLEGEAAAKYRVESSECWKKAAQEICFDKDDNTLFLQYEGKGEIELRELILE